MSRVFSVFSSLLLAGSLLSCSDRAVSPDEVPELVEVTTTSGLHLKHFRDLTPRLVDLELFDPLSPWVSLPDLEAELANGLAQAVATARHSRSAEAFLKLGQYFHYLERFDLARAAYARAASLEGDLADDLLVRLYHFLGDLEERCGQIEASVDHLERAVATRPESPDVAASRVRLAKLLVQVGDRERAEREFERAVKSAPARESSLARLAFAEYCLAARETERAADLLSGLDSPRADSLKAALFRQRGELDRALDFANRVGAGAALEGRFDDPRMVELERDVDALSYYEGVAQQLGVSGSPERIRALRVLVRREPLESWRVKLAEAYAQAGQLDLAESVARQAVAVNSSARSEATLGKVLLKQGQSALALDAGRRSLTHEPDYLAGHEVVARAAAQLERFELAYESAARLISLDPDRLEVYLLALRIDRFAATRATEAGSTSSARRHLERARKILSQAQTRFPEAEPLARDAAEIMRSLEGLSR